MSMEDETIAKRLTNLQLAGWLNAEGGQVKFGPGLYTEEVFFECDDDNVANAECPDYIMIRKQENEEWHEPTVDYVESLR